jgi:hypothetical protein
MKKLISLLVVIGVAGVWLPAMAKDEPVQSVYFLQSRDLGDPPEDLVELCDSNEMVQEAHARVPGALLQISPLNAEWWSAQPRSKDGMIKSEFVRKTGTALGCGYLMATDSGLRMALYGDSDASGIRFVGWGECDMPIAGMPTAASLTGNCSIVFEGDESLGIAGGLGTSNSVFGEGTGSFWTIRIFWENEDEE